MLLLPPAGMVGKGMGEEEVLEDGPEEEGEGPSDAIISMTLGKTM